QWVKNLIVFVPLVTAHKLSNFGLLFHALWAFASFSLCGSGVYLMNDLVDLDVDRQHSGKKERPLASGDLPLGLGLTAGPLLLIAGVASAIQLSWLFGGVVAVYLIVAIAYSLYFKRVALLDVFSLAGLYTIRLVAGQAATGLAYSNWLLIFSMFIFL